MLGMLKEQAAAQRAQMATGRGRAPNAGAGLSNCSAALRPSPTTWIGWGWMSIDSFRAMLNACQWPEPEWAKMAAVAAIRGASLRPSALMEIPFERTGMDRIGPFHRSAQGYCFIFVLVDYVIPKQCRYAPFLQRVWHKHSFRSSFDWHPERDAD